MPGLESGTLYYSLKKNFFNPYLKSEIFFRESGREGQGEERNMDVTDISIGFLPQTTKESGSGESDLQGAPGQN